MDNEIKLIQKPKIQHALTEVGKDVTTRIDALNITNLVATDDTIQSLKKLRADLTKELKNFEDQRKELKSAIAKPYQDFEALYKEEVAGKYKSAIDVLKDKIGEFEINLKNEKKENVERYFNELCHASNIDFVKFSNLGLTINLSTSEKKYKEKCDEFIQRVADDVMLIDSLDFSPEIMAEYKRNGLNASKAIKEIQDRKEAERLERERKKIAVIGKRQTLIRKMAFVYHDFTKTYNWVNDESVSISEDEIENLSDDDFNMLIARVEMVIAEKTPKPEPKKEEKQPAPEVKKTAEPLKAPEVKKPEPKEVEKTYKANFRVTGTMEKLMALKKFLVDNNYKYENI